MEPAVVVPVPADPVRATTPSVAAQAWLAAAEFLELLAPTPARCPREHLVPAVPVAPADPAVPAERREAPGDLGAVAVPVARVDPVEAAVRADPAVRPVVAVISVVAVVVRVDPAVAPVDPAVAPVGHRVVPVAAAVASVAPVVVATPLVRSASPAVVPRVDASPSGPSVKSSTTWRPRPSAEFDFPAAVARQCAFPVVRR